MLKENNIFTSKCLYHFALFLFEVKKKKKNHLIRFRKISNVSMFGMLRNNI